MPYYSRQRDVFRYSDRTRTQVLAPPYSDTSKTGSGPSNVFYATASASDIAINAAIQHANNSSGNIVVQLSGGTFTISTPLILANSNIRLRGDSIRGTVLRAANNLNDNIIRIGASSGTLTGIVLEDFEIDGNYTNQNDGSTVLDRSGIYFKGVQGAAISDLSLRNLYVASCRGAGIALEGTFANPLTRAQIDNVRTFGNGLSPAPVADGIHITYANDLLIDRVSAQINTDTGLAMDHVNVAHVSKVVSRGNASNQITVARGSKKVALRGCTMDGLDAGLGQGAYGLRTGTFSESPDPGITSNLIVDDCTIIRNTVGMQIDNHSILQVGNTYCPGSGGDGNTTPFATSGTFSFGIFGSGNVGITSQSAGTFSIAAGATSSGGINHNLNSNLAGAIPIANRHVTFTLNNAPTNAVKAFYVAAVRSTQIAINCDTAPGTAISGSWQVRLDV